MTAPDNPVGHAFSSFITSPVYWDFIAWSQIIGSAVLVNQRFARAAVLIYLLIILTFFILIQTYGFAGTNVFAGLMLLAAIYPTVWEGDVLQYHFIRQEEDPLPGPCPAVEPLGLWSITGVVMVHTLLSPALTTYWTDPALGCLLALPAYMTAFAVYLARYRPSSVRHAMS